MRHDTLPEAAGEGLLTQTLVKQLIDDITKRHSVALSVTVAESIAGGGLFEFQGG